MEYFEFGKVQELKQPLPPAEFCGTGYCGIPPLPRLLNRAFIFVISLSITHDEPVGTLVVEPERYWMFTVTVATLPATSRHV